MSVEVFVDTNILFYANTESPDPRHGLARARVQALWDEPGRAAVSVQVLQELHVNLMRKAGLDAQESAARVAPYFAWHVVDNDRELLKQAFAVQLRWQASFWDAMILAAAQRCRAPVLWSEDFARGQRYGEVLIENPLGSA